MHAVAARSTFRSQNVQNTPASDHLRCRKNARRCGTKHISKSRCTKQTHHARTTFGSSDVEKVHAVVAQSPFPSQNVQNTPFSDHFWKLRCPKKVHADVARSTFPSQNVQNTRGADHFWQLRCRKSARRCGAKHMSKSRCTKQTHQSRTTFGSSDVEKVHAVVARSTFPSQNVQNTPFSHHFWKLRCRESARRCGAKHISKSKCTKHQGCGPLLAVEMSKKCTPVWREAHVQVKMYKTNTPCSDHFWQFRCRKSARCCGAKHISKSRCTKHIPFSDHFWKLRCRKSARRCDAKHISKSICSKHYGFGPLLEAQMSLRFTTLYIILDYITFPYSTLQYTALHSTTLQLQLQLHNYTPLRSTTFFSSIASWLLPGRSTRYIACCMFHSLMHWNLSILVKRWAKKRPC